MPIVFGPPQINIKLILAKTITQKGLGVATPISAGHLCCQHTILVFVMFLFSIRYERNSIHSNEIFPYSKIAWTIGSRIWTVFQQCFQE